MPLSGCSNGLFVSALVAILLVPAPYFVTDLLSGSDTALPQTEDTDASWLEGVFRQFPPVDLFITSILLSLGLFVYLCEWIQRKLMETRLKKLNSELAASVQRLQKWDLEQEQLEATLAMVQSAGAEYNLLLYLLLRQSRRMQPHSTANCFLDKDLNQELNFLHLIEV